MCRWFRNGKVDFLFLCCRPFHLLASAEVIRVVQRECWTVRAFFVVMLYPKASAGLMTVGHI